MESAFDGTITEKEEKNGGNSSNLLKSNLMKIESKKMFYQARTISGYGTPWYMYTRLKTADFFRSKKLLNQKVGCPVGYMMIGFKEKVFFIRKPPSDIS